MCNFSEKNPNLMLNHKESHKERSDLKCLMCGSIFPTLDSYKKHQKKHKQELNVGPQIDYPMNVYNYKCTPCKISFKTNDELMDHMFNTHLSEEATRKNIIKVSCRLVY